MATAGFTKRMKSAARAAHMLVAYRNPWMALANRVGLSTGPGEVCYRLRSGASLFVEKGSHDVRVVNEVWLDHIYEIEPGLIPQRGWCVLDIGAHKGIFASRAASTMQEGTICAYEPDSHNYCYLLRNVSPTAQLRFQPRNAGVGARTRKDILYLQPLASGQHSLYPERLGSGQEHITIDVVSLKDVIAEVGRAVDLLKLDVEGAEYEIVLDSPPAIFESIHRIVMELDATDPRGTGANSDSVITRLKEYGYRVRSIPERSLVLAFKHRGSQLP